MVGNVFVTLPMDDLDGLIRDTIENRRGEMVPVSAHAQVLKPVSRKNGGAGNDSPQLHRTLGSGYESMRSLDSLHDKYSLHDRSPSCATETPLGSPPDPFSIPLQRDDLRRRDDQFAATRGDDQAREDGENIVAQHIRQNLHVINEKHVAPVFQDGSPGGRGSDPQKEEPVPVMVPTVQRPTTTHKERQGDNQSPSARYAQRGDLTGAYGQDKMDRELQPFDSNFEQRFSPPIMGPVWPQSSKQGLQPTNYGQGNNPHQQDFIPPPPRPRKKKHRLGELQATAICGNDITASCFYIVGQLCKDSGIYAPLCTIFASVVLYCFRAVYAEVVTALPLNGGIYNLLLNSSSKKVASVAACLTIMSYVATGVVSSVSAMHYTGVEDVLPGAIGILCFFAFLMLCGIKESGYVAFGLFAFHLGTLLVLFCACAYTTFERVEMFVDGDILHLIAKNAAKTNKKTSFPWPGATSDAVQHVVLPSNFASTPVLDNTLLGHSLSASTEWARSSGQWALNTPWSHDTTVHSRVFRGNATSSLISTSFGSTTRPHNSTILPPTSTNEPESVFQSGGKHQIATDGHESTAWRNFDERTLSQMQEGTEQPIESGQDQQQQRTTNLVGSLSSDQHQTNSATPDQSNSQQDRQQVQESSTSEIPHAHRIFHKNLLWEEQQPTFESIFFGFSTAMLGVSGFETSANFVENQRSGVFPKTLQNMWILVTIINISFSFFALLLVPLDTLTNEEHSDDALAFLGTEILGETFGYIIRIDAFLVLAGSVLTSYVGVVGLFERMSADKCLPEIFSDTTDFWTVFCCRRRQDIEIDKGSIIDTATSKSTVASKSTEKSSELKSSDENVPARASESELEDMRGRTDPLNLLHGDVVVVQRQSPKDGSSHSSEEGGPSHSSPDLRRNTEINAQATIGRRDAPFVSLSGINANTINNIAMINTNNNAINNTNKAMSSSSDVHVSCSNLHDATLRDHSPRTYPLPEVDHRNGGANLFTTDGKLISNDDRRTSVQGWHSAQGGRPSLQSVNESSSQSLNSTEEPSAWASILFFLTISTLLCYFLEGDIEMLTDMYSIAFLLVMALFAACGLWMKYTRPTLPRKLPAPNKYFVCGFICVLIAFLGALLKNQPVLFYFFVFYLVTLLLVMSTFYRVWIITQIAWFLEHMGFEKASLRFLAQCEAIKSEGVIFFAKDANFAQLNRVLLYIFANEDTGKITMVHCNKHGLVPKHLENYVKLLSCLYPTVDIQFTLVKYSFGGAVIPYLTKKKSVPANCMFITCPTEKFKLKLENLGGVRVILNDDDNFHGQDWVPKRVSPKTSQRSSKELAERYEGPGSCEGRHSIYDADGAYDASGEVLHASDNHCDSSSTAGGLQLGRFSDSVEGLHARRQGMFTFKKNSCARNSVEHLPTKRNHFTEQLPSRRSHFDEYLPSRGGQFDQHFPSRRSQFDNSDDFDNSGCCESIYSGSSLFIREEENAIEMSHRTDGYKPLLSD